MRKWTRFLPILPNCLVLLLLLHLSNKTEGAGGRSVLRCDGSVNKSVGIRGGVVGGGGGVVGDYRGETFAAVADYPPLTISPFDSTPTSADPFSPPDSTTSAGTSTSNSFSPNDTTSTITLSPADSSPADTLSPADSSPADTLSPSDSSIVVTLSPADSSPADTLSPAESSPADTLSPSDSSIVVTLSPADSSIAVTSSTADHAVTTINQTKQQQHQHHNDAGTTTTATTKIRFCGVKDDDDDAGRTYYISNHNNITSTRVRVRRYTLHGSKWEKTEVRWTLRTPSRHSDRLDEGTIRSEFYKAVELWQRHSNLKFQEVRKEDPNVDIYIDFVEGEHGDQYTFDGPGLTLAHAFYPGDGIGGDMHFDDAETFVPHAMAEELEATSLFITAAHELGHALGIRHSDAVGALMAPFYQTFPLDFDLPFDDRYAIQALYGNPKHDITTTTTTRRPPRPQPTPPVRPPTRPPRPPTRPPWPPTRPPRPPEPPTRPPRPPEPPTRPPRPPEPPTRPPWPPTRPPWPPTRPPWPPTRPPRPTVLPPTQPTRPTPPPTLSPSCTAAPPTPSRPDTCLTTIDATVSYFKELYFFKDHYYWRIRNGKAIRNESPGFLHTRFPGLPTSIQKIDAVYETSRYGAGTNTVWQDNLVFFSEDKFYELNRLSRLVRSGNLADLGINATKLDAAMRWGHNGRVYLFSRDRYWRLGAKGDRVEMDYPRDIAVWRGLPPNYSAALTILSHTYFFAGRVYWEFDVMKMRTMEPSALTAPYWFTCPFYNQRELNNCSSPTSSSSQVVVMLSWSLLVLVVMITSHGTLRLLLLL
ncbi:hypothetical protein Pcinc_018283 [Petrolisthes cinctipes]|uniref:Peptidase metallopeptidase domain-containing protein n=1 Tax=Petrolisthes cinctipes TaxID=88211 RepID=A0AAE1FPN0_PETCI|nr:hypothetical protein Pcinc_018283 [Petrolisthes cinctipes]